MAEDGSKSAAEPFDTRLNETATAEDVSEAALQRYARALDAEPSLELLAERGFLDDKSGRLTNAGTLLFARRPGEHIARAGVVVEVRAAAQRRLLANRGWKTDFLFDEPLTSMLPVVESYVDELLQSRVGSNAYESGYPRRAWREGLVNAVAHRDYGARGGFTTLSILDGRIEISNAGGPANGLPVARMREARCPRNPTLARSLVELGWMHGLGVGVDGIYESMGGTGVSYNTSRELDGERLRLTLAYQNGKAKSAYSAARQRTVE